MLLLGGEDLLEHPPGGGVVVAQPPDDLLIRGDRHALRDQVLPDHVQQVARGVVLRVRPGREALGGEVGLAAELDDPSGGHVGMHLLLVRVLEELLGDGTGVDALGGEVVALVAQHAHQLGGEDLVQDRDHPLAVGGVGVGDRSLLDLLARATAERLDVGQELTHGQPLEWEHRETPYPASGEQHDRRGDGERPARQDGDGQGPVPRSQVVPGGLGDRVEQRAQPDRDRGATPRRLDQHADPADQEHGGRDQLRGHVPGEVRPSGALWSTGVDTET